MLFSYGSGWQEIDGNKKCRQISGDFDCHGDAAVRHGAHRPIEHVQGFHWKPLDAAIGRVSVPYCPGGLHCQRIHWKNTNTNKTQLLASNYGTFWSLVVCENFTPQNRPPLLSSLMQWASFKCEMPRLELKSSRTFLAIKCCQRTKS